jgi:hypothetical protein
MRERDATPETTEEASWLTRHASRRALLRAGVGAAGLAVLAACGQGATPTTGGAPAGGGTTPTAAAGGGTTPTAATGGAVPTTTTAAAAAPSRAAAAR